MNAKLTLSLDKATIERAKAYAQAHQTSLSSMVMGYFQVISHQEKRPKEYSPLVKELIGVAAAGKKYTKRSLRKDYTDYLWKKYQ